VIAGQEISTGKEVPSGGNGLQINEAGRNIVIA